MKIIYTGAARASTPRYACHTLYTNQRARIICVYIHTHTHTHSCSLPYPPLLSLFYGHVINILSTRGGQNFDSFFLSFFFVLSLSLSFSSHHPPPPTEHPPTSRHLAVPKSCMKMIFLFFFSSPPPPFGNVSHGF